MMEKDERLEKVRDKIRSGIPVGMLEAIEAIEYQAKLRADRKPSIWGRFIAWLNA